MKFTLSWLADHLETEATLEEIADMLTRTGLEVESVEDPRAALAPFTVARVLEAKPHPDADRLTVCTVETGNETVQVICGAPNVRAGMKGVFAPAGSYVPGIDLKLKKAKIRGVESQGMLCSEREMMISDEHEGIIELPADAPLGASFAEVAGLDDPVIDIAITPNRPDALGVAGIARDLAAAGLGRVKTPAPAPVEGRFACPVRIETDDAEACPVFVGRLIRGVKNGPSPDWLQRRLRAIGLRPISALVDITNFIAYDRGRPLHVYDAAKLTGRVRARLAEPGESFTALDGKTYETLGGECLIADDSGPLGFGGVIGGEASGVTEETTEVLVESALFDPVRTAETGRRHGIESDARYRFERGVDPDFVVSGMEIATAMILELAGGEPSEITIAGKVPGARKRVAFDPARIESLGGIALPSGRAREILEALGCDWAEEGDEVTVFAPPWRPDIDGEADLVEEVLRIHGYDAIPDTALPRRDGVARATLTAGQRRARAVKRRLASEGLDEAVTYSFMDARAAGHFGGNEALRLENPISSELDMMRPSILPNLLLAAGRNRDRGASSVALFEVGPSYLGAEPGEQLQVAACVRAGSTGPRHWAGAGGPVDVFEAKRDALAALEAAGAPVDKLQVAREAPSWFHPGRSGAFKLGPKMILAVFGELHPGVLKALDIDGPAAGAEVFLDRVPQPKAKARRTRKAFAASNLPAVERDFAFLVDAETAVGEITAAARSADKEHIAGIDVFDVYQGKGIPEGRKSVAIAVRLEPTVQTFTEAEIDSIASKIVSAVETVTGGTLRR